MSNTKEYTNLEMTNMTSMPNMLNMPKNENSNTSQNSDIESISTTDSINKSNSIRDIIKQKSQRKVRNCKEGCKMYGWVAPSIIVITGVIVGLGYLVKFISNTY